MPLVLAIKNRTAIVVASDSASAAQETDTYGQLMPMPNRTVLLLVGNLEAVRHTIMDTVVPKVDKTLSAAGLAQIVHAALVIEIVPKLAELKGRIEVIVAGIDPIRHTEQPGLYYMDSAQDFQLTVVTGDAAAAGSTAAVTSLLAGHSYADSGTDHLKVLAKECLASTKMRWPGALANHMKLGAVTPEATQIQYF